MARLSNRWKGLLISILVLSVFFLLVFYRDSVPYEVTIDRERDGHPPRPHYPPFQPPPLKDHAHMPPWLAGQKRPPPLLDAERHWFKIKPAASTSEWKTRANSVKEAFLHTYNGYEKYAPFPSDELQPLANKGILNFNGWGVTMVDALDTMLLMDLTDQYSRAVGHVASIDFLMPPGTFGSFFETVIRYLGGLLSAYALSEEPIMLARAMELGEKLLPAFDTPSGLPISGVNPQTGEIPRYRSTVYLAEMASCQMEYKYLAHVTGRKEFFAAAHKVMDVMNNTQHATNHLWPTMFSNTDGQPVGSTFTVGSLADSAYEYLLKQYLMSNKTETRLAELYVSSMNGILSNLLYLSPTRKLLYVTDSMQSPIYPTRTFEHLSCFFPGLLALGVSTLPESLLPAATRQLHMWAAEGIAHTCWVVYADAASGLGAETVTFDDELEGSPERWTDIVDRWEKNGKKGGKPPGVMGPDEGMPVKGEEGRDYSIRQNAYLLRPETLESMYIMYRTTRDSKWRERGWQIWEAIVAKTKTSSGFATVDNVDTENPVRQESLPSYFLAETVKYAYLLALDYDPLPVSDFVFNTEAHPLPVFQWRDWEREKWGIK